MIKKRKKTSRNYPTKENGKGKQQMIKTQIHNLIFYSLFFHTHNTFLFSTFTIKKKKKKNFKENFYNSRTNKERIVKFLKKKKKNPQFERKKVFPIFLNLKKKRFNYVKRKEKKKKNNNKSRILRGRRVVSSPNGPFYRTVCRVLIVRAPGDGPFTFVSSGWLHDASREG